jgi:citrate lyase beta subunit
VRSAEAAGQGAAQVGGVMIDAANIRISQAVLERAALLGLTGIR